MGRLLAASFLGVQGGTSQSAAALPEPAVVLQVTMPSGSVSRLTIRSGMHGSVGLVLGPTLNLSPTLTGDGSLEIAVTPVAWDPSTGSLVANGTTERRVVRPGETARFADASFPIVAKWMGTTPVTAWTGASSGDEDAERCCVICGSEVTCACEVITPCGDCCSATCSCEDGSAPSRSAATGSRRQTTGSRGERAAGVGR
jgi:hypothetical protein